jgi:spore maturation protein CgeB
LAFGQALRDVYLQRRWTRRAWTWHEAADTRVFFPLNGVRQMNGHGGDLVWIGNWGDDDRTAELQEFFIRPARKLRIKARAYGVRYPPHALKTLRRAGIEYRGWLPNYRAPHVFSHFRATVHIPHRPPAEVLEGIPSIRPFEALACGIPLICAPWEDREGLFEPGQDFLVACDGNEMEAQLREIIEYPALALQLARHGRSTVLNRHTCAHRVQELFTVCKELGVQP